MVGRSNAAVFKLNSVFTLVLSSKVNSASGGSFQIKSIYDEDQHSNKENHQAWDPNSDSSHFTKPQFIEHDSGNVSAILGKPATLNCRVRAVGNRTVRSRNSCQKVLSQIYLITIYPSCMHFGKDN